MKKYRLQEYVVLHLDVNLLDFKQDTAHMEYHIQERVYYIFWKSIKKYRNENEAKREFKKYNR